MFIVTCEPRDSAMDTVFGPFDTKEQAEGWLAHTMDIPEIVQCLNEHHVLELTMPTGI